MEPINKFKKCHFPGQRSDEIIQQIIRKHWIMDVEILALFLLFGAFPILIALGAGIFTWDGLNDYFLTAMLAFFLYLLTIYLIVYVKWLNEELDLIIVTNESIISHEQIDLFHRQISEAHITQIQDVKGTEKGVLSSIFHYGNLEIQTSSPDLFFSIRRVVTPYENARKLLDIRDIYTKNHRNS